jgi:hypothetical protein
MVLVITTLTLRLPLAHEKYRKLLSPKLVLAPKTDLTLILSLMQKMNRKLQLISRKLVLAP